MINPLTVWQSTGGIDIDVVYSKDWDYKSRLWSLQSQWLPQLISS
jgi:hypothetical protein